MPPFVVIPIHCACVLEQTTASNYKGIFYRIGVALH